ncbi:MAG: hypothetical protein MAG458_01090 [Nitrosopumilus sp.]|nr:hypothetical protein [Nitrosopumilus sp.]
MKIILLVSLLLVLIISPAFGQLSDSTGLVKRLDIEVIGHTFEVVTTSNFDVEDHEFNKDEKRLTLFVYSGLENNLGELIIPNELLSGNFTFFINDLESIQTVKSNDTISFVTLTFNGIGNNKIDIVGTDVLFGVDNIFETQETTTESPQDNGGGCLIATATYGSEMATQVQQLREIRDNQLLNTESGKSFVNSFNDVYYSFSPIIADYERENPVFREAVKLAITPMISTLSIMSYAESDSEVVSLGIGVILLNLGMYLGVPITVVVGIKKRR